MGPGTMTADRPRGCTAGPPKTWMVIGVIDVDAGELIVAAVIEGVYAIAATLPQTPRYGQYATTVEAPSAEEAQQLAMDTFGFGWEYTSPTGGE
jgi:hypothetical protein